MINRINIIVAEVGSERTQFRTGKQYETSFNGEHWKDRILKLLLMENSK